MNHVAMVENFGSSELLPLTKEEVYDNSYPSNATNQTSDVVD
jgi:hypothetical protein